MNPYYQPPGYESPHAKDEQAMPAPVAEKKPARHGWYFYIGGFFLLAAGVCLVLSNSLGWHPAPLPPPANSTAK